MAPTSADELLRRAQAGDSAAVAEFVEQNIPLVRHIVRRFQHVGLDVEDLFQIGCIGLLKAIKGFRPELGTRFSTYAMPVIIGEIRNFLRSDGPVKVGRDARALVRQARRCEAELKQSLNRAPTVQELAEYIGVDHEQLLQAMEALQEPLSLHEPRYGEDHDDLLIDYLADTDIDVYEQGIDSVALEQAMMQLDERLRLIIRLRFFEEKTQQEVAELLNVSQVQISRLEKKALIALRSFIA